jgi:heat shock protein HslJ
MTGDSGCNTYRASYTTSGSKLSIGPDIASTQMACPPLPTAVETAYLGRLTKVARYAISASTLTLAGSDGTVLLTFRAAPGASALTGKWTATGYYTGTAVQSITTSSTVTAEFAADQISGNGGCNTFSGPFATRGETIKIGPLRSTLTACPSAELGTQEQQYLAALELARTYTVTGSRLDLFRADGGFAVTFER